MIKEKLFELRQLKEKILYIVTDINILKQINSKQMFEYAKMEMKQLKQLKTEFQQVQQELHDLLDKETKQ